MLTLHKNKELLRDLLSTFVWTYKIGDNIIYNLDLVYRLVDDHNSLGRQYAKPIAILCVSVIEASLVDFLERLESATAHFPLKLATERELIKARLNQEQNILETVRNGQVRKHKRLKNIGYDQLISLCEELALLGRNSRNYSILRTLGRFRNRVHIRNYFDNFERDESRVFSEARAQSAINHMESVIEYLSLNYPRP